jgi:hypothetical protein
MAWIVTVIDGGAAAWAGRTRAEAELVLVRGRAYAPARAPD